jgi:hypothetical protein
MEVLVIANNYLKIKNLLFLRQENHAIRIQGKKRPLNKR